MTTCVTYTGVEHSQEIDARIAAAYLSGFADAREMAAQVSDEFCDVIADRIRAIEPEGN